MDLFTKEYAFMRALPIFVNETFIISAFNFVKASTTYVMNVVATFITYDLVIVYEFVFIICEKFMIKINLLDVSMIIDINLTIEMIRFLISNHFIK
jgi:hypothetical protein